LLLADHKYYVIGYVLLIAIVAVIIGIWGLLRRRRGARKGTQPGGVPMQNI
jgi:hypothetical protein